MTFLELFQDFDYQRTVLLKLLLAAFLGSLVGLERQVHGRPAGFRTHLLVSLGACLMAVTSEFYYLKYAGMEGGSILRLDPGRVSAQIITGIGFLGAGVILKEGQTVRGLTTAACLWVAAGIGMAIGVGLYLPAVCVTLISLVGLLLLKRVEGMFRRDRYRSLVVTAAEKSLSREILIELLGTHGFKLVDFSIERNCEEQEVRFDLLIVHPEGLAGGPLTNAIAELDQVKRVRFR